MRGLLSSVPAMLAVSAMIPATTSAAAVTPNYTPPTESATPNEVNFNTSANTEDLNHAATAVTSEPSVGGGDFVTFIPPHSPLQDLLVYILIIESDTTPISHLLDSAFEIGQDGDSLNSLPAADGL